VLMGLLFMAAMGLPLFGVFSSFMTMMFAASTSNPSMVLVLLVWFVTSLLLLKVWHVLFYGRPREDLLYQDLTFAELLPFAVMIGLLVLGGRVAANVFPVPNQSSVAIATAEGHP
jgi:NADH:ubiquinone oxidoreductase subunit 4 (subunit M)